LGNRLRDAANIDTLLEMSWRVLVVWECATRQKNTAELTQMITLWLQSSGKFGELDAQAEEIKTNFPGKREPRTIA
jgi:DNA mismatch endonuclease, patch repair protein